MQSSLEQQNLIYHIDQIKILIGFILFMVMYKKLYQMIFLILWVKSVTTTTTVDVNLNHCLASGRSLTDC